MITVGFVVMEEVMPIVELCSNKLLTLKPLFSAAERFDVPSNFQL